MFMMKVLLFVMLFCTLLVSSPKCGELNVNSYTLTIEPSIVEKNVKGSVIINFTTVTNKVLLSSGNLKIDTVIGESVEHYRKVGEALIIKLTSNNHLKNEIRIDYHGKPKGGLLFNPKLGEAYTVYSTNLWMPCNDDPKDKATFSLNILVPKGMQCVASGEFVGKKNTPEKEMYKWEQTYESPFYTFGFVIGNFIKITDKLDNVKIDSYSSELNENDLEKVFVETSSILRFFEEKSGVKYVQNTYSQILIGKHYQEMSGLSILSNSYSAAVLKDSSEIHLTSHELAHQWWGNLITCENFSHFWLNEAFAVYMASAYSEYRFGKEKYNADIAIYKSIYNKLVENDNDKSLIIPEWTATKVNRHIVYYKGAYVLHLLRQKLGNDSFWKGIRDYSQKYFGKSVKTNDFKMSMEKSANINLDSFFEKWVY